MTTYVSPFTGQTINPSQVGYESLTISADTYLQWPINGNTINVVANIIDVTATTSNLRLILPAATEVSTGQTVLIRNLGSNSFTVTDNSLNTIITIASGVAEYIYLVDNTTINGTWESVQLGAGTSAANAATLAGYGLKAVNSTLNTAINVSTLSSAYTFSASDRAAMYVWTGGAGTVTLPTSASVGNNWFVIVKNDGTGILNIALSGTDTIDGNSSAQLQIGESFVIVSGNSAWYSYAYGRSSTFYFTQLVVNVTGGTVTLTNAQGSAIIQEYKGVLTSNCTVIVPPTVQLYSFSNLTTGAYSLTFSTGAVGGTTITLGQNQTIIAICDGTNVYNSQTATSSSISSLTLGNGSAANPSLSFTGDATTGLYLAASHQLGLAVAGVNAGTLTSSGLLLPVGINGGAF